MNGLALEVEIEPAKKNFDERTAQEEEARIWPEESGFDRVKAASNATTSVLEDAEERLLETEPSTLAGLIASGLSSKSAALVGCRFRAVADAMGAADSLSCDPGLCTVVRRCSDYRYR